MHRAQQAHKGILDPSNFCIKTGSCPSLRQSTGRAAGLASVSPRKGAGEGANSSLPLLPERVTRRMHQSICSWDIFKSVPRTGLRKQWVDFRAQPRQFQASPNTHFQQEKQRGRVGTSSRAGVSPQNTLGISSEASGSSSGWA